MSELSLKAAYSVYMKWAPDRSLEGLLRGIAKGRREYGPPVSKIFSFKDVNDTVQLFYCQEPGEEQRVQSSSHARDLHTVYSDGSIGSIPGYLNREFNAIRTAEAEEEANRFKLQQPIRLEQLGEEIHRELEQRGWSTRKPYDLAFEFFFPRELYLTAGDYDKEKSRKVDKANKRLDASLEEKGFRTMRSSGGDGANCYAHKTENFAVDRFNILGKEIRELMQATEGVELLWLRVERIVSPRGASRKTLFVVIGALVLLGILIAVWYLRQRL